MQIIVAKVAREEQFPDDIDNLKTTTWSTGYNPVLNEVTRLVKAEDTAVVDGDDIKLNNESVLLGMAEQFKMVEVDSAPDNFKPNAFTYDGTTWAVNPWYDKLHQVPKVRSDAEERLKSEQWVHPRDKPPTSIDHRLNLDPFIEG